MIIYTQSADLAPALAAIATVDTVVDNIRAVDVPALVGDHAVLEGEHAALDAQNVAIDTVVDAVKVTTDKIDPRIPESGTLKVLDDLDNHEYILSDDLIQSNDAEVSEAGAVYVKKKEIWCPLDCTCRVYFEIKEDGGGHVASGQIHKSGVAHGIERTDNAGVYKEFNEDLAFVAGDLIQLYVKVQAGGLACVRNFRIKGRYRLNFENVTV